MDFSIVAKIAGDCLRIDRVDYPQANILTIAHDNDRSLRLPDGRWYSPLIDTMEDDLRARDTPCVSAARIISRIKGDLAYGRVYSPDGAFARALVTKRLASALRLTPTPYSGLEEKTWGRILDQTGARKVFGIQPSRELCAACHERGVWVADVQHGVISQSHPWYGARFRGNEPREWLPDAFLSWDEGSRLVTDEWASAKGIESTAIGNRWIARFMHPAADDALVQQMFADYRGKGVNPTGKPQILVAFSWGEVNIPNGFMSDALLRVIRATADRYHWAVRLHPNQLNGFATDEGRRFNDFFRQNLDGLVEWEVATRSPLPLIMSQTDLAVCWNSSVALEAALMGRRSALLDPRLRAPDQMGDYYEYHRATGMISFIEDDAGIIESWVDENLDLGADAASFDPFDRAYARVLNFLAS